MSCPECGFEGDAEIVVVPATPEGYAKRQAGLLSSRKGVESTDWRVDDGMAVAILYIAQDDYETHNHFLHRGGFEGNSTPHIEVVDVEPGVVELHHHQTLKTPANRCRDCGHVWPNHVELVDNARDVAVSYR